MAQTLLLQPTPAPLIHGTIKPDINAGDPNASDSTKLGGGVAKANNAGAASTGPNLHPMRYLRKQFFSVLLVV